MVVEGNTTISITTSKLLSVPSLTIWHSYWGRIPLENLSIINKYVGTNISANISITIENADGREGYAGNMYSFKPEKDSYVYDSVITIAYDPGVNYGVVYLGILSSSNIWSGTLEELVNAVSDYGYIPIVYSFNPCEFKLYISGYKYGFNTFNIICTRPSGVQNTYTTTFVGEDEYKPIEEIVRGLQVGDILNIQNTASDTHYEMYLEEFDWYVDQYSLYAGMNNTLDTLTTFVVNPKSYNIKYTFFGVKVSSPSSLAGSYTTSTVKTISYQYGDTYTISLDSLVSGQTTYYGYTPESSQVCSGDKSWSFTISNTMKSPVIKYNSSKTYTSGSNRFFKGEVTVENNNSFSVVCSGQLIYMKIGSASETHDLPTITIPAYGTGTYSGFSKYNSNANTNAGIISISFASTTVNEVSINGNSAQLSSIISV